MQYPVGPKGLAGGLFNKKAFSSVCLRFIKSRKFGQSTGRWSNGNVCVVCLYPVLIGCALAVWRWVWCLYNVPAWANCVAYLGRWAMREPDERDKQEQLPTLEPKFSLYQSDKQLLGIILSVICYLKVPTVLSFKYVEYCFYNENNIALVISSMKI